MKQTGNKIRTAGIVLAAAVLAGSLPAYAAEPAGETSAEPVNAAAADGTFAAADVQTADIAAPSGTAAEIFRSSEGKIRVRVTWSPVLKADGYAVYARKSGNAAWKLIKKGIGSDKIQYTYTSTTAILPLKAEKTYQFTVVSADQDGNLGAIGTRKKQRASVKAAPGEKTQLVSAKSAGYNSIRISWEACRGADGYLVYRKTASGKWKELGTARGEDRTFYLDTSAQTGKTYTYTVRQYWDIDGTPARGPYDTSGIKGKAKLSKPVLKSIKKGTGNVKISWSETAGAQGYVVYRKKAGGSYVRIATLKGNASVSLTDAALQRGVKYAYKVKAYRIQSGDTYYSGYSNVKTVMLAKDTAGNSAIRSE